MPSSGKKLSKWQTGKKVWLGMKIVGYQQYSHTMSTSHAYNYGMCILEEPEQGITPLRLACPPPCRMGLRRCAAATSFRDGPGANCKAVIVHLGVLDPS